MNVSNVEQKRVRLKQFLKILSEDPSLLNQERQKDSRSLAEFLMYTGYTPRNEPVNMAELVSLLLKRVGHEARSEDMMEHVMNGGTVDEFMNISK
ncbi:hypothetical protein L1N85_05790 [Paenibacillus alkaliterrae]|uniref:hypothetical protein n=1 Tax=Paenibacillus alkaliterrae TaxID=320909 RepID=UPI001F3A1D26|nr:hypothetical protein [Paenibacillus alkaliterrae]MCF2937939.1 hypothetical protein [Paenibacillus alkaliterrae]